MNRESLKLFLSKCYGYTFRDVDTVMKYFDDVYKENSQLKLNQEDFIKWLEDNIKETTNAIERLEGTNSCKIPNLKIRLSNYQEVLDKFRGVIDE